MAIFLKNVNFSERHCPVNHSISFPNPYEYFVGRAEDIRNITQYLDYNNSNVQVVHIWGPPGFGKSTLAIKIGHVLLGEGVSIYYMDMTGVSNDDTLLEKFRVNIVGLTNKKVSLYDVQQWVQNQSCPMLIILDNCDAIVEANMEEFLKVVEKLRGVSDSNKVKYLITAQENACGVTGKYRNHEMYNLSSEAASQLLQKRVSHLSLQEAMTIAELTGNVAIALDLIGAVFNYHGAPSASELIEDLRANNLSSPHIDYSRRVSVSIDLAYQRLTPELRALGHNLSLFPGSFDSDSAYDIVHISSANRDVINDLVRRSLLHFSKDKRYQFHQLIQKCFFAKIAFELDTQLFNFKFQRYYTLKLDDIIKSFKDKKYHQLEALDRLEKDQHNFKHMLNLFADTLHTSGAYNTVKVVLSGITMKILQLRFTSGEIRSMLHNMLHALEMIMANKEIIKDNSFLQTYADVTVYTARQETLVHNVSISAAVDVLLARREKIENALEKKLISVKLYVMFYTDLAQYYSDLGDEHSSKMYHTHLLRKVHNQLLHCHPTCDYYSISMAYEYVQDTVKAIHFRELALTHQSLSSMTKLDVMVTLHQHFSNEMTEQSDLKAENLSRRIIAMHPFLMGAKGSLFSDSVFYGVIDHYKKLQMNNDYGHELEHKLVTLYLEKIKQDSDNASDLILEWLSQAYMKHCYLVVSNLGPKAFVILSSDHNQKADNHTLSKVALSTGMSLYITSNYTGAQVWLRKAIELFNENLTYNFSFNARRKRNNACIYLTSTGDFNCILVLVKEQFIVYSVILVHFIFKDEINTNAIYAEERNIKVSKQMDLSHDFFCVLYFPTYQCNYFSKKLHSLKNEAVKSVVGSMTEVPWVISIFNVLLKIVKGGFVFTLLALIVFLFSCCGVCCNIKKYLIAVIVILLLILILILTAYFFGGIKADDLLN